MAAKLVNKEQLVESVRKLPCLYDTSTKEYKDEMERENAWKRVYEEGFQKAYHNDKAICEGKIVITSYLQREFPDTCILIYIMLASHLLSITFLHARDLLKVHFKLIIKSISPFSCCFSRPQSR